MSEDFYLFVMNSIIISAIFFTTTSFVYELGRHLIAFVDDSEVNVKCPFWFRIPYIDRLGDMLIEDNEWDLDDWCMFLLMGWAGSVFIALIWLPLLFIVIVYYLIIMLRYLRRRFKNQETIIDN